MLTVKYEKQNFKIDENIIIEIDVKAIVVHVMSWMK